MDTLKSLSLSEKRQIIRVIISRDYFKDININIKPISKTRQWFQNIQTC